MPEHGQNPTASAKATLKRIPGLVVGVRQIRSVWRSSLIAMFARAINWSAKTRARRALVFEALRDQLALAVHPQESYVVNTSDKVIGARLFDRGDFDLQKLISACKLISSNGGVPLHSVLIDIGANLGSICIPAVRRGLVQRAIAFELDPDNTRLLRINALLNGVEDRIDIRNMAVGAAVREVTVKHSESNFGDHRVLAKGGGQGVSVPMVTLDSIAQDLDLSRTILWIDIQGYEAFALQGARYFLAAGVPLIVEFSREELDSTGSFDLFLSIVTNSGYAVFYDINALEPKPTPLTRTTLEVLSERLTRQGDFTDLLLLPTPSP